MVFTNGNFIDNLGKSDIIREAFVLSEKFLNDQTDSRLVRTDHLIWCRGEMGQRRRLGLGLKNNHFSLFSGLPPTHIHTRNLIFDNLLYTNQ